MPPVAGDPRRCVRTVGQCPTVSQPSQDHPPGRRRGVSGVTVPLSANSHQAPTAQALSLSLLLVLLSVGAESQWRTVSYMFKYFIAAGTCETLWSALMVSLVSVALSMRQVCPRRASEARQARRDNYLHWLWPRRRARARRRLRIHGHSHFVRDRKRARLFRLRPPPALIGRKALGASLACRLRFHAKLSRLLPRLCLLIFALHLLPVADGAQLYHPAANSRHSLPLLPSLVTWYTALALAVALAAWCLRCAVRPRISHRNRASRAAAGRHRATRAIRQAAREPGIWPCRHYSFGTMALRVVSALASSPMALLPLLWAALWPWWLCFRGHEDRPPGHRGTVVGVQWVATLLLLRAGAVRARSHWVLRASTSAPSRSLNNPPPPSHRSPPPFMLCFTALRPPPTRPALAPLASRLCLVVSMFLLLFYCLSTPLGALGRASPFPFTHLTPPPKKRV